MIFSFNKLGANWAARVAHARSRTGFQHMQNRGFYFFQTLGIASQYRTKNSAISITEDNLDVKV